MRDRLAVIDGLRGSAIFLVVLFHIYLHTHFAFNVSVFGLALSIETLAQAGNLGVDVFFFVSGFCLMLPYAEYMCGRRDFQSFSEYASRRFWKIVPSYYLAVVVLAIWFPFEAQPGISRVEDVALHLTFLHSIDPLAFSSLNSNFWSLAVEVQFYAIFPLIVVGFLRRPLLTSAAFLGLGLGFSAWIAATNHDGEFLWAFQMFAILPLFMIGAITAYIYERWVRDAQFSRTIRIDMIAVAVLALAGLDFCFKQMTRFGGGPVVWQWENAHRLELGLLLAAFTLTSLAAPAWWQRIVGNRALSFLSDISYNMYLWNAPVIALVSAHWALFPNPWQFSAVGFGAIMVIGWILTYAFERPLMRGRLRFFFRPVAHSGAFFSIFHKENRDC